METFQILGSLSSILGLMVTFYVVYRIRILNKRLVDRNLALKYLREIQDIITRINDYLDDYQSNKKRIDIEIGRTRTFLKFLIRAVISARRELNEANSLIEKYMKNRHKKHFIVWKPYVENSENDVWDIYCELQVASDKVNLEIERDIGRRLSSVH